LKKKQKRKEKKVKVQGETVANTPIKVEEQTIEVKEKVS
jgi:hypothetical protein